MEPTQLELAGFDTLGKASLWAGFSDEEFAPVLLGLGSPTSFREVASIPSDRYSTAVNAVLVNGPQAVNGSFPQVALTPRLLV